MFIVTNCFSLLLPIALLIYSEPPRGSEQSLPARNHPFERNQGADIMKFRSAPALVVLTLFFSAFFSAAALNAQQPASDSGTISATTELVLVPAQVKGHDGKPLLGLKQEDFVLRSDGKPQPIRVFEETTRTPASA